MSIVPVDVTETTQIVSRGMAGASVVRIVGDVDLAVAARLREVLDSVLAAHAWVIVDLRRAEAVDSIGLGVLLAARQAARRRDGDLVLAAVPPFVRSVLSAARLASAFTTFDTVPQAITFALRSRAERSTAG
jgi:anti-anti-sigma factor